MENGDEFLEVSKAKYDCLLFGKISHCHVNRVVICKFNCPGQVIHNLLCYSQPRRVVLGMGGLWWRCKGDGGGWGGR